MSVVDVEDSTVLLVGSQYTHRAPIDSLIACPEPASQLDHIKVKALTNKNQQAQTFTAQFQKHILHISNSILCILCSQHKSSMHLLHAWCFVQLLWTQENSKKLMIWSPSTSYTFKISLFLWCWCQNPSFMSQANAVPLSSIPLANTHFISLISLLEKEKTRPYDLSNHLFFSLSAASQK